MSQRCDFHKLYSARTIVDFKEVVYLNIITIISQLTAALFTQNRCLIQSLVPITHAQTVTLATSTPGATIRYTLNGTTPTSTTGTLYTTPITIETIVALRAVAFKAGMLDSAPANANFAFNALPVATPVISPDAGTFTVPQIFTITCATPGATIRYTTDGSTPNSSNGTIYAAPFTVSSSSTIKAMAYKSGSPDSGVATASISINPETVSTPVITPATCNYTTTQTVSITCATPGAIIRYTTDGSTPAAGQGILYTGPFAQNSSGTVKTIATASDYTPSPVTSVDLTITDVILNTPTLVESFDYSLGALNNLNGGTGFAGAYPNLNTQTVVPPLASAPDAFDFMPSGNAARFASGSFTRPLASANQVNFAADGTRFFSFLFRAAPTPAGAPITLLQWTAFAGNSSSANPNITETANIVAPNLAASSGVLSRGAGFNPNGDASYGWWPSNNFGTQSEVHPTDLASAIDLNLYASFTITPANGNRYSLNTVSFYAYNGASVSTVALLYSTDGFSTHTSLGTRNTGSSLLSYDVSGVSALQSRNTPVTFRVYFYGEPSSYQVRGLGGSPITATPALSVTGSVTTDPEPVVSGSIGLKDASNNRVNLFGIDVDTAPANPAFTIRASGAGLTPASSSIAGADGVGCWSNQYQCQRPGQRELQDLYRQRPA